MGRPAKTAPPSAPGPDGQPVTLPSEAAPLLALIQSRGQASEAELMRGLGLSKLVVRKHTETLAERGLIRHVSTPQGPKYQDVHHDVRPELVDEALKPQITAFLLGCPNLPSAIARHLNAPLDRVTETCKSLRQEGVLRVSFVGCAVIYHVQGRERHLQHQPPLPTRQSA